MRDIKKIFKSLEEFGLLKKGISETVKNETNKTLAASILVTALSERIAIRASKGVLRAGQIF